MSIREPCQDGVTHAASPTDAGQAPASDVAAQSDESQSYSNNILL